MTVQTKHQNLESCIVHHTCTKHPFEGHPILCTEISVWQLFSWKNFWKSDSQSNTCKLKSNWRLIINIFYLLEYISLNNNKLVCFVRSEGWFKVHDLVHQFLNKCRRDACFSWCIPAPNVWKNCAQEFLILSTLKAIIIVITIIVTWWIYILIKEKVFPTGRGGGSPPTPAKNLLIPPPTWKNSPQ